MGISVEVGGAEADESEKYNYSVIDTTELNVDQVAEKIAEIAGIGT